MMIEEKRVIDVQRRITIEIKKRRKYNRSQFNNECSVNKQNLFQQLPA